MKVDRRLYLTEDKQAVVEEGDPRAFSLLVGENGDLPDAEAERLGVKPSKGKPKDEPEPEPKAEDEPAPKRHPRR